MATSAQQGPTIVYPRALHNTTKVSPLTLNLSLSEVHI